MIRKWEVAFIIIIVVALFLIAMQFGDHSSDGVEDNRLVVVSPHPVSFITPLIQEFENESGIRIELLSCGTSTALESITSDENVDVLWGGSLLAVGSCKDSFLSYKTLNRATFKNEYREVSPEFTCFSDVPSVIMVNEDIIGDIKIEGYEDLLDERLKGQIAYASPGSSSSSFEHLVNMLYDMGNGDPEKGWDYAKKFAENLDGNLLSGSSEVYQGVADGKYKVGLTFEEAAVTMLKEDKHIRIIYMNEGVLSTPDGIYISKNSKRIENAERFVDFLTSKDAQLYMASELGRRSVRKDVEASGLVIPSEEIKHIEVDRDYVIENKSLWVERFISFVEDSTEEKEG